MHPVPHPGLNVGSTGTGGCLFSWPPGRVGAAAGPLGSIPMGAAASLTATTVQVEPGGDGTTQIRVRNTGSVVDQFTVDVVGDPAPWSSVEPPTLSLLPGNEGSATVHFRPPRSSEVGAGAFPFGVRVTSKEDPGGSVTEEGTLEVGAFTDLVAELVPHTSHGRVEGRHELALDNRGNQRLNADLAGVDDNAALRFHFSPAGLVSNPNTASFVNVGVRPVKRFWKGPPRSHPFKITVRPQSTLPVTVDGILLQEAILPRWLLKALAALLALAILAAILWATLVHPAIKSAAQNAAAGPLATQAAQIAGLASGQQALKQQVGNLTGSPVPSPTGIPVAAASPAPFFTHLPNPGTTFPANSTRSDSYTVPANSTLSITDIVFENPQGDSGSLSLQVVSGSPTATLLVENLDNFRDLDYHFISPPVLTAAQKLQITVTCAANNGANATPPQTNRACTPSVFFSGFLKTGS
jgi:hypothetical protein